MTIIKDLAIGLAQPLKKQLKRLKPPRCSSFGLFYGFK